VLAREAGRDAGRDAEADEDEQEVKVEDAWVLDVQVDVVAVAAVDEARLRAVEGQELLRDPGRLVAARARLLCGVHDLAVAVRALLLHD
jgi:hypothetical protein